MTSPVTDLRALPEEKCVDLTLLPAFAIDNTWTKDPDNTKDFRRYLTKDDPFLNLRAIKKGLGNKRSILTKSRFYQLIESGLCKTQV